jgi:hypothetical protein
MVFHQIAPVAPASRLCGQYRLEARANNIEIMRQPWTEKSKLSPGRDVSINIEERIIIPYFLVYQALVGNQILRESAT